MSINLYSGLSTAQIIAQGVAIQMPITSSGTTYDSLGGGGGGGGGTGDVVGPASATDLALAIYDGTTGKLLQNSALTLAATTLIGTPDITIQATGITTVVGGNYLNLQSNTNIYLDPVAGNVILQDGGIVPDVSGTHAVGIPSKPFASGSFANLTVTNINGAAYPPASGQVWCRFSGTNIIAGAGVSSIANPSTGVYTFYFTTPFSSATSYYGNVGYIDRQGMGSVSAATALFYPQAGTPVSGQGFSILTGYMASSSAFTSVNCLNGMITWNGV